MNKALSPALRRRRLERVYWTVTALHWFGTVLPMAVTVLLAQQRGLSLAEIGLYSGLYSLTVALLEVPTGSLADRWGRRRLTVVAYGVGLLSKLIFLFAFSLPMFLLYALVYGAARALGSGALEAWFVDELQATDPDGDLQPPLARAGAVELSALGLGTLVGGALPGLFPGPASATGVLTPLSLPVVASFGLEVLTLLAVLLLVRETPGPHPDGHTFTPIRSACALAWGNPKLRLLLAVSAINGLGLAAVETFWQPHFARLMGGSPDTLLYGLLLAGCFGVGVLGNLLATPLNRLLGGRTALSAALLQGLQGLSLLLLAAQSALLAAGALLWLHYLARSGAYSPFGALYNAEVPSRLRSVMLSWVSLASFAGAALGSAALGPLAQAVSVSAAWTVAGALALVGALLLITLQRHAAFGPPGPLSSENAPGS